MAARAHAGVLMSDCVIWAFIAGLIIDRGHLESRMQSEKLNSFLLSSISYHLNWIWREDTVAPSIATGASGATNSSKPSTTATIQVMYPCSTNTREVLNKLIGGIYNTSRLHPRQPIPADVSLPLSLFLATAVEDGWTQVTVAPEPYVFANPCPPSMRGVRISELSSVDIRSHHLLLNIIVIQPL